MESRIIFSSLIALALIGFAFPAAAQERKLVRKGNALYQQKKYDEAAKAYQQALQKQPGFLPGMFNLGDALMQQKKYDAARQVLDKAAQNAKMPDAKADARYNIGNSYMSEQKWQEAVDAYKQALRNNPQDADAKYNLSYALAKLRQQQQQDGGGDKNQQDKQDQKDKQNQQQQNQDQKEKNKQQQNQQGEQDQQKQPQHPQPQQSKISEQQADNLLKALEQDERKLHDRVQKGKAVPIRLEKDW
jgi:tetratricopeptide (TPR) repeat protein